MRRKVLWVGLAWAMGACAPPEAPTELNDLSRYMYREWDATDERTRVAGMANLDAFLTTVDVGSDVLDDRTWTLTDLQDEDVATITRPDRPLENCFGIGMAYQSRWPASDHARLQIEPDQVPTEPTAEFYDRTITNVDDPSCFVDQSCDHIDTSNDMRRKTLLYSVDSVLLKNFRWVNYTDAEGVERTSFYSRSWYDQPWPGDKDKTTVWQSYSIDVWMDRGDGTAWRYQTLWNETEIGGIVVTDGAATATVRPGTENVFEAGDDAIGTLYHDEPAP